MSKFSLKQGDTSPKIRGVCEDVNGDAIDLTGATVRFHMREVGANNATVDNSATLIDAANGIVEYAWETEDTETAGFFQAEWEVTYSDDAVETFPNTGYIAVQIIEQIA